MRILIITKMPPYPPNIGGNQRSNLVYRALSKHGQVDVLLAQDPAWLPESHLANMKNEFSLVGCVAPQPRGACPPWSRLRPLCPGLIDKFAHHLGSRWVEFLPDPNLRAELLRLERQQSYDLLVGMELRTTFMCGFDIHRPHIVDLIDLDTDYYRSRLADRNRGLAERYILKRHLAQLECILPVLLKNSRLIWVANRTDLSRPELQHARVLPNIPFVGPGQEHLDPLPPADSFIILFVGSFYHAPNVEGVGRFLKNVWPHIVQAIPPAEFHIFGMGVPPHLQEQSQRLKNVRLLGSSGSLREAYKQCAFTVAPIYSGAGTCFKVVESLAMGRTMLLSPYAARGYENVVQHEQTAVIGRTEAEMVAFGIRLLQDTTWRNRLASEGSMRVNNQFNYGRFQAVVDATIHDLHLAIQE